MINGKWIADRTRGLGSDAGSVSAAVVAIEPAAGERVVAAGEGLRPAPTASEVTEGLPALLSRGEAGDRTDQQ
ncbi:MAG: hypothetical protein GY767_02735 [Shimia sp.]|nr:hypothetical protein [Shimia sp.]